MARALACEVEERKKTRNLLQGVSQLMTAKKSVNIRLKTFRNRKVASGDGDVGRYC